MDARKVGKTQKKQQVVLQKTHTKLMIMNRKAKSRSRIKG